MPLAAGALAKVVVFRPEQARPGAAATPASPPAPPVMTCNSFQLKFATYFPAALALTGLPRQEVFEIEVIVVAAAAIDASTFHAQGSGVEPVLFASPRLFSGKR
jgi:hypothetical protein